LPDKKISLLLAQFFTLLAFFLMTLGSLIYFGFEAVNMLNQLTSRPPSITFERGAYYLLGIGIASGALLFIILLEVWTKVPPSAKATKIFTITAISSIALSLVLPIIAGTIIESYLLDNEYTICDVPSSAWPIYKDVIYTDNPETCSALILKREETIQGYRDSWK